MCSDIVIAVEGVSKNYQIYDSPRDRLMQMITRGRKQYFREFSALNDVSLEIKKGETVGIIGRNGSGKSTLLQIICGTLNPSGGHLHTTGRIAALLELGSGFNPDFTGRENVFMNASILGLSRAEIEARYDDIASFADIGDFIDQPIKSYSSGMVVRLAFSVAINVDPQILVVDEALSVGDELFQRKCFSRIEAIRDKGTTILFVSHSGGTIIELCDRAILLEAGEKLTEGMPKQVVASYQKLLYAPAEKQTAIREQIRGSIMQLDDSASLNIEAENRQGENRQGENNHGEKDLGEKSLEKKSLEKKSLEKKDPAENKPIEPLVRESYDPNLKPASTIAYESHGAHIESPAILTVAGEKVNNLIRGETYRYTYLVRFTASAAKVGFGMLIKTTSGVELGGGVSASNSRAGLALIQSGETYRVEFRFQCNLNPGVYFLNAGVTGETRGSEGYLHRMVDIAMFRVIATQGDLATGYIDFRCDPDIERINAP